MISRIRPLLVALFYVLLFTYSGAGIYRTLSSDRPSSSAGWAADQVNGTLVVTRIRRDGPASVLREGDEIIALNGQRLLTHLQLLEIQNYPPGQVYTLLVQRRGQLLEFSLQTGRIPASESTLLPAILVIITALFLITGFTVYLLKPSDKQAVLLALMFGMFIGAPAATVAWSASAHWSLVGVTLAVHIISLFLWPVFFHFFLIFPEPSPLLRQFPRIEYYLYAPHLLTIFPYFAASNLLFAFMPESAMRLRETFSIVGQISIVLFVLYIAGGLMSLLVNYRQAGRPSKRKMRVVVAGSVAGFLPTFIWLGLVFVFDLPHLSPELSSWLFYVSIFAFPLFPLSFAYAIVRHQVIPVRLIIRRGVRYLLVSRGFIIVQALVVFVVLSFLLSGRRVEAIDQLGSRADIVVTMLAAIIAIALLTLINQRVLPLIDRRFFRESYDAQEILSDLGQEMRRVASVDQLIGLAARKIQDAIHPENVTIFLHENGSGDYRCVISSYHPSTEKTQTDSTADIVLPGRGAVIDRLKHVSAPLTIGSEAWIKRKADAGIKSEVRAAEIATLRMINSALLLPVATKNQLLGVISLGLRLGDLPFSSDDKQLLMAVSWQMAFAIQNAQLVQQVAEEERLRHELEIATTVQQRLFPQAPPKLGRVELAGLCHPARGVGGDYYDFIVLDDTNVGIAVADVAGKGISAALLMSTVQASLRSQAPSVDGNLTELVSSMNRLLHLSTDASSYATFFYAQLDEKRGLLTYVNAGHNPPMLLRAAAASLSYSDRSLRTHDGAAAGTDLQIQTADIGLLTTGGPVIGAFHGSRYEQETIEMGQGDLLVAYTDGLTEARNTMGEEFGEQRLRSLLVEAGDSAPAALSEQIVKAVRDWSRDTVQEDDLTLVVIKLR